MIKTELFGMKSHKFILEWHFDWTKTKDRNKTNIYKRNISDIYVVDSRRESWLLNFIQIS